MTEYMVKRLAMRMYFGNGKGLYIYIWLSTGKICFYMPMICFVCGYATNG